MRLWHGTSSEHAAVLAGGRDLDPVVARSHQADPRSLAGFYLAEVEGDARHFAATRNSRDVLIVDVDSAALGELLAAGAVWQDIQKDPRPPYFAGRELYLPPGMFPVFNRLRREGLIRVAPAPGASR